MECNRWESLRKFSEFLTKSVIYDSDGLVILSKPYGIPLAHPDTGRNTAYEEYTLTDSLPFIAKSLGYEKLIVVKAPERYTSGITVLSPSEKVADKVKRCLLKGNGRGHFCSQYLAVVLGEPKPLSSVTKVALKLRENPVNNSDKKPFVLHSWSKTSVEKGLVKVVRVQYNALITQHLASLVEISCSARKWHFLRVYLAHLLSPILGDHLYGNRVHYVMDTLLPVNHFSDSAKGPQKLHPDLKVILGIKRGEEQHVPMHLHLKKLIIPDFTTKKTDFIIEVEPPEYFRSTCQRLNLTNPEHDICSRVRMVNK
ncbi:hypothetical protein L9F63_000961 [Diploptera punctata]|uniref:Pseudouridine synthase RsuA/RluA-like domain-containing protein n=1 Tax=Diploptera punctata TaxID=6984 RepID=A0AAD8AKI7_DIPPU|nr:hypothetical protein L9F63_000961 [Diploptera punctata]